MFYDFSAKLVIKADWVADFESYLSFIEYL